MDGTEVPSTQVPSRVGSGRAAREDYALQRVPPTWRYRTGEVVVSLLGGATAAIFLATPAEFAEQFGWGNVLVGIGYALVVQTLLNLVYVRCAQRTGLSSDLMSRGLALGFDGSAWTTLLYWVTWLTYFGTEGQILSSALSAQTGLPVRVSYVLVGLVFLPLVLYGLRFIARFQKWTLYLYVFGIAALIAAALSRFDSAAASAVLHTHAGFGGLGLLGALAAYNGLIGNIAFGHADVGRLLANEDSLVRGNRRGTWWVSLVAYPVFAYLVFGLLGLFFWSATGGGTDPGAYAVDLLGVGGFLLISLTQLRINLINAYSGSLSLANFFSRMHLVPGRSVWAVAMVVLGTGAMYLNILDNLGTVLVFEGVLLAAWVGVTFADLVVLRGRFGFGPRGGSFVEYRRAMLPHWNPVGVVPLFVATVLGGALALGGQSGAFGGTVSLYLSSWLTFLVAGVLTVCLGLRDRGRSYAVRETIHWPRSDVVIDCPLHGEVTATDDLFPCPHHGQWICSQDCMRTKSCRERCRSMSEEELLITVPLPPRAAHLSEVNTALSGRTAARPDRPFRGPGPER